MIGDEVVRYNRKLSDRFTNITRGRRGTTEKDWVAGTFLRQIPELVYVAPVGIAKIESESQLVSVSVGAEASGRTERKSTYQIEVSNQFEEVIYSEVQLDLQPQLDVNSISDIIVEVVRTPPTLGPASVITTFETVVNQTIVVNQIQTVHSEFLIQKNQLEVLLITPPGGVIDGYQESLFITDPIDTRGGNNSGGLDGEVELDQINDRYYVVLRDTSILFVDNAVMGAASEYAGKYTKTNAGHRISHFDGIFDDGFSRVSGLSLGELDLYYGALTIKDFTERANSSYTLAGDKFNLLNPSIQNPATLSTVNNSIVSTIGVQDTTFFPDEGYVFHNIPGVADAHGHTVNQRVKGSNSNVNIETTAEKKFGDKSVALGGGNTGTDNFLSIDMGSGQMDWIGSNQNFTMEWWQKFDNSNVGSSFQSILYFGSNTLTGVQYGVNNNWCYQGFNVYFFPITYDTLKILFWNGEDQSIQSRVYAGVNDWHHIAIQRKDGFIKMFLDGTPVGNNPTRPNTQDYTGTNFGAGSTGIWRLGHDNYTTVMEDFSGHIDELRISDIARFDVNGFTPQTEQYVVDANTKVLENFDTSSTSYSGVIKYTGKTANSFTGCTLHNGDNQIKVGSEMVPFTI